MHALDVLGDPVRRRIVEVLVGGEVTAGSIADVIRAEMGISQPAVSQHLKTLRDNGFVSVRIDGPRRWYALDRQALRAVDEWLAPFRGLWEQRLDALETELARGARRAQRRAQEPPADDRATHPRTG